MMLARRAGLLCRWQWTLRRTASTAAGDQPKRLTIFFGSQTGTAQGFASELASEAQARGLAPQVVDLKGFRPSMLSRDAVNVFLLACYGKGEPTDNAREFYTWLTQQQRQAASDQVFDQLPFAVFGLGNKRTHSENFNVIGRRVDRQLESLGAKRIFPRVDGDDGDCIETQFDEWQLSFLDNMQEAAPEAAEPAAAPKPAAEAPAFAQHVLNGAAPCRTSEDMHRTLGTGFYQPTTRLCRVTSQTALTPASSRVSNEIHIDLAPFRSAPLYPTGELYRTGDHAVVYARNEAKVVDAYLELLGRNAPSSQWGDWVYSHRAAHPDRLPMCLWPDMPELTFRDILTSCVELMHAPTPGMLRALRSQAATSRDADRLAFYASHDNYAREVTGKFRTLLDVLTECSSVHVSPPQFLDMMPRLKPRFYSISSSAKLHPDEIHLTYRVVQLACQSVCGHMRLGMCSNWLSQLQPSDSLQMPMYLWSSTFRLPQDSKLPVIMIAGGTGIAPFKAFVEERMAAGVQGDMRLYYGVRDETEYMYKDMMEAAQKSGCLAALQICQDVNPDTEPRRVSDLLLRSGADTWKAIQQGGSVYVCGGANGFGPSVVQALLQIFSVMGGMSAHQARTLLSTLMSSGRYHEDLSD